MRREEGEKMHNENGEEIHALLRSSPPKSTQARPRHFCSTARLALPSLVLNAVLMAMFLVDVNRVLLSCEPSAATAATSSWKPSGTSVMATTNSPNASTTVGYVPYEKVIGHLHYAKTVGTEINGELAAHYERVCGHKGYSYDATQFNKRVETMMQSTGRTKLEVVGGSDLISSRYRGYNRGRVTPNVMDEIGYEDCDYISWEGNWRKWTRLVPTVWPLELHVPCRDPLDHLMSQCNHHGVEFECDEKRMTENESLESQVENCLLMPERFDLGLTQVANLTLKCFNPLPMEPYLDYMDKILQRKRFETQYVHRSSNTPRVKTSECIWKNDDVANRVLKILQTFDYYHWCHECVGSENDLLRGLAQ